MSMEDLLSFDPADIGTLGRRYFSAWLPGMALMTITSSPRNSGSPIRPTAVLSGGVVLLRRRHGHPLDDLSCRSQFLGDRESADYVRRCLRPGRIRVHRRVFRNWRLRYTSDDKDLEVIPGSRVLRPRRVRFPSTMIISTGTSPSRMIMSDDFSLVWPDRQRLTRSGHAGPLRVYKLCRYGNEHGS